MPSPTITLGVPAPTIEQDRTERLANLLYIGATHLEPRTALRLMDAQHYLIIGGTKDALAYLHLAADSCDVFVSEWAKRVLKGWDDTLLCGLHYAGYAACQLTANHGTRHRDANGHQFVLPVGHPGHLSGDRVCTPDCITHH